MQLCDCDKFLEAHTERDNGDVAGSIDPKLSVVGEHRIDERADGHFNPSD